MMRLMAFDTGNALLLMEEDFLKGVANKDEKKHSTSQRKNKFQKDAANGMEGSDLVRGIGSDWGVNNVTSDDALLGYGNKRAERGGHCDHYKLEGTEDEDYVEETEEVRAQPVPKRLPIDLVVTRGGYHTRESKCININISGEEGNLETTACTSTKASLLEGPVSEKEVKEDGPYLEGLFVEKQAAELQEPRASGFPHSVETMQSSSFEEKEEARAQVRAQSELKRVPMGTGWGDRTRERYKCSKVKLSGEEGHTREHKCSNLKSVEEEENLETATASTKDSLLEASFSEEEEEEDVTDLEGLFVQISGEEGHTREYKCGDIRLAGDEGNLETATTNNKDSLFGPSFSEEEKEEENGAQRECQFFKEQGQPALQELRDSNGIPQIATIATLGPRILSTDAEPSPTPENKRRRSSTELPKWWKHPAKCPTEKHHLQSMRHSLPPRANQRDMAMEITGVESAVSREKKGRRSSMDLPGFWKHRIAEDRSRRRATWHVPSPEKKHCMAIELMGVEPNPEPESKRVRPSAERPKWWKKRFEDRARRRSTRQVAKPEKKKHRMSIESMGVERSQSPKNIRQQSSSEVPIWWEQRFEDRARRRATLHLPSPEKQLQATRLSLPPHATESGMPMEPFNIPPSGAELSIPDSIRSSTHRFSVPIHSEDANVKKRSVSQRVQVSSQSKQEPFRRHIASPTAPSRQPPSASEESDMSILDEQAQGAMKALVTPSDLPAEALSKKTCPNGNSLHCCSAPTLPDEGHLLPHEGMGVPSTSAVQTPAQPDQVPSQKQDCSFGTPRAPLQLPDTSTANLELSSIQPSNFRFDPYRPMMCLLTSNLASSYAVTLFQFRPSPVSATTTNTQSRPAYYPLYRALRNRVHQWWLLDAPSIMRRRSAAIVASKDGTWGFAVCHRLSYKELLNGMYKCMIGS